MKRNIFCSFLLICFFCLTTTVFSQDKIITKSNDSIECRITRVTDKTIFFDLSTKGIISSGKISRNLVSDYIYSVPLIPIDEQTGNIPFNRFRIGINAGIGYITGSSKEAEKEMTGMGMNVSKVKSYYKDLKLGNIANAEATYYFSEKFGAGVKYRFYENSASIEDFVDPQDGVNVYYTTFKENIYVNYVAGAFYYEEFSRSRKLKVDVGLSIGYTMYRDEATTLSNFLLTGKTLGLDCNLGFEYFIRPQFSLYADFATFASTLTKVDYDDGAVKETIKLDKDRNENLSRIDLSIGVKLYLGTK